MPIDELPQVKLRDETPLIVHRGSILFPEPEFLNGLHSAGVRQVSVPNPPRMRGGAKGPLCETIWDATDDTRHSILWLHTVDIKKAGGEPYYWNRIFEDLYNCEGEQDQHIVKGITIKCNISTSIDMDTVRFALRRIFMGSEDDGNHLSSQFMKRLDHVELQLCPSKTATPNDVEQFIEEVIREYSKKIKGFGLDASRIHIDSIHSHMDSINMYKRENQPLSYKDDTTRNDYIYRVGNAIHSGADTLSYGLKKPTSYHTGAHPLLPNQLLEELRKLAVIQDNENPLDDSAYCDAYRLLPDMQRHFE